MVLLIHDHTRHLHVKRIFRGIDFMVDNTKRDETKRSGGLRSKAKFDGANRNEVKNCEVKKLFREIISWPENSQAHAGNIQTIN